MTSPNDVIAQLEARANRFYVHGDVYYHWPDNALDREAASLIKTLTQAVETEREECAKVADATAERVPNHTMHYRYGFSDAADVIASAIRARSTQDKT